MSKCLLLIIAYNASDTAREGEVSQWLKVERILCCCDVASVDYTVINIMVSLEPVCFLIEKQLYMSTLDENPITCSRLKTNVGRPRLQHMLLRARSAPAVAEHWGGREL